MGVSGAHTRSRLILLGSVLLLAVYVGHCLAVNYISDDGFISFRYVRNWVRGDGIVYNPGERVEGYAGFTWIAMLAGLRLLLPGVELLRIAQVLGILFGALTILLMVQFSWKVHDGPRPLILVGPAFLAVHGSFVAWSTAGLETPLFVFLLFAAACSYAQFLRTDRGLFASALLFALAAMTRPDGGLLWFVTTLHLLIFEWRRTGQLISKRVLLWGLAFSGVYGTYFIWRYSYYGYLLPNTAYAKVGAGIHQFYRGARYLKNYLVGYGLLVFLPPFVLLLRRKREAWRDYFALLVAVHWIYIIYVGGDGLSFFRFVTFTAPLLYLLVQEGFAALFEWVSKARWLGAWGFRAVAAAILLVSLAYTARQTFKPVLFPASVRWYEPQSELHFPGLGTDHSYKWFDNYFVDRLATAAHWLERNAPPNSVVASTPAGAIGYYTNLRVIDMLGLNDIHIAHSQDTLGGAAGLGRAGHEKGDGRYVLSRSPEFILMGNVAVLPFPLDETRMEGKLVLKSEHEIWNEPSFHRDYEFVCVRLADSGVFQYFSFYKKKGLALPAADAAPCHAP